MSEQQFAVDKDIDKGTTMFDRFLKNTLMKDMDITHIESYEQHITDEDTRHDREEAVDCMLVFHNGEKRLTAIRGEYKQSYDRFTTRIWKATVGYEVEVKKLIDSYLNNTTRPYYTIQFFAPYGKFLKSYAVIKTDDLIQLMIQEIKNGNIDNGRGLFTYRTYIDDKGILTHYIAIPWATLHKRNLIIHYGYYVADRDVFVKALNTTNH